MVWYRGGVGSAADPPERARGGESALACGRGHESRHQHATQVISS